MSHSIDSTDGATLVAGRLPSAPVSTRLSRLWANLCVFRRS